MTVLVWLLGGSVVSMEEDASCFTKVVEIPVVDFAFPGWPK